MGAAITAALEGFKDAVTQINKPRRLVRDANGVAQGIE
jgi:hypothetical protein